MQPGEKCRALEAKETRMDDERERERERETTATFYIIPNWEVQSTSHREVLTCAPPQRASVAAEK